MADEPPQEPAVESPPTEPAEEPTEIVAEGEEETAAAAPEPEVKAAPEAEVEATDAAPVPPEAEAPAATTPEPVPTEKPKVDFSLTAPLPAPVPETEGISSARSNPNLSRTLDVYTKPKPPSSHMKAGDWKKDKGLEEWAKKVEKRKLDVTKRKVRQANKDANWVLARRQQQLKLLRERQKEEEARARARELEQTAIKSKFAGAVQGRVNQVLTAVGRMRFSEHVAATPRVSEHHGRHSAGRGHSVHHGGKARATLTSDQDGPLSWKIPPVNPNLKKTEDVGVWVKPGLFVTRQVQDHDPLKKEASFRSLK